MEISIKYFDFSERFGMCGPWIGKLKINGEVWNGEYLLENFLVNESKSKYVFNRFDYNPNLGNPYFREFKILIFNPANKNWLISKNCWTELFLTKITDSEIFYTNAFHNQFPEKAISINFQNFEEVETAIV